MQQLYDDKRNYAMFYEKLVSSKYVSWLNQRFSSSYTLPVLCLMFSIRSQLYICVCMYMHNMYLGKYVPMCMDSWSYTTAVVEIAFDLC